MQRFDISKIENFFENFDDVPAPVFLMVPMLRMTVSTEGSLDIVTDCVRAIELQGAPPLRSRHP
jgi:hypothetical protein